jgi:hypothetical protein
MHTEHRRALRHLLGGAVEVTDLESGKEIVAVARNLSPFGCFVATATPFLTGTKVRLRIAHRGATFAALVGWPLPHPPRVWGLRGIALGRIETKDRAILDTWLGEKHGGVWRRFAGTVPNGTVLLGALEHHVSMSKMKTKEESDKTLLSNVKKEMAKPRMTKSARGENESSAARIVRGSLQEF